MLEYYVINTSTFHNGELIDSDFGGYTLCEAVEKETEEIEVTWENLESVYPTIGMSCGFNVWNSKRGQRVSFFNGNPFKKNFRDVKEWKKPLNIRFVINYRKIEHPTVKNLEKFDAVKVQKYLAERA